MGTRKMNGYSYVMSWIRVCPELNDTDFRHIIADALHMYTGEPISTSLEEADVLMERMRGKDLEELDLILRETFQIPLEAYVV